MKRDPVHGRLHFHVPHKVPSNGQDRIKPRSTEHLLHDPVLALISCPVFTLFVHEEQDLVQHHLQLARILDSYKLTTARQEIPDWEIHVLIKPNPVCVHSINRLLIGNLRLSRHMVLQTNLSKGHGSAQYKLKTQSEERTTPIRFMQIRPANHRSSRSHVCPQTQGIGGIPLPRPLTVVDWTPLYRVYKTSGSDRSLFTLFQ